MSAILIVLSFIAGIVLATGGFSFGAIGAWTLSVLLALSAIETILIKIKNAIEEGNQQSHWSKQYKG